MTALQVRVDRKRYTGGEADVLQDLTLRVGAGEFVALVGPSGAGKSTLLNIASGLDADFEGEVRLDGRPLAEAPVRLGFVFQEPRLMPWLSVLDNVRLVVGPSAEAAQRSRTLLRQVGLADSEALYPGQLSLGMQRRVALARAFVTQPALLLLDEPFVSLDAPTAAQLRRLLLALCQRLDPSVLFVTHELREALALADRVVFLSGRPAGVLLDYRVEAPRTGNVDHPEVARMHEALLRQHPGLLSGLVHAEVLDLDRQEENQGQGQNRWMNEGYR